MLNTRYFTRTYKVATCNYDPILHVYTWVPTRKLLVYYTCIHGFCTCKLLSNYHVYIFGFHGIYSVTTHVYLHVISY
jgi:hypothetical protein